MVKLYSFEACPWCQKVKKYLQSKNVAYEVHDIQLNEDDLRACIKLSGDNMVPVITTDDKNFVIGFDKPKIDALLGL